MCKVDLRIDCLRRCLGDSESVEGECARCLPVSPPRFSFCIFPPGFFLLDFSFWIFPSGFFLLDFSFWIFPSGFFLLDFSFWIFPSGFFLLHFPLLLLSVIEIERDILEKKITQITVIYNGDSNQITITKNRQKSWFSIKWSPIINTLQIINFFPELTVYLLYYQCI